MSMSMSIHIAHKRETSNALYALVRSIHKHKRFQMLPKCISANSRIHAGSPARSSTLTDQPQRKHVGRWCLTVSVERPGVVDRRIQVVAVMRHRRLDGRNLYVKQYCFRIRVIRRTKITPLYLYTGLVSSPVSDKFQCVSTRTHIHVSATVTSDANDSH